MLDLMPRLKGAGLEYPEGYVMLAGADVEYTPWITGYIPEDPVPEREDYIGSQKGDEVCGGV